MEISLKKLQNLNHPNATCNTAEKSRDLCISDLETYVEIEPEVLKSTFVDYQYILAFDNYRVDNALIYEEGNYDHFMSRSLVILLVTLTSLFL